MTTGRINQIAIAREPTLFATRAFREAGNRRSLPRVEGALPVSGGAAHRAAIVRSFGPDKPASSAAARQPGVAPVFRCADPSPAAGADLYGTVRSSKIEDPRPTLHRSL